MNNDVLLVPITVEQPNVESQSDIVVYVPQAHKNKPGIVKEGDGVLVENGVVSLNRQTVEDMIDANKWVSYGFQQNLTNEEKGLARHNIGAGDNDFTGSYYDVTQKPHLKTDNTNSLDTGDEEINHTINLHKVSKTGSFDDLNDVPTETIDFAESERQKSKNLLGANLDTSHTEFGITFVLNTDGSINVNGTATWNATFKMDNITLPAGDYFISVRDANNNFISNAKIQIYYDGIYKDIENQVLRLDSEKACEFEFYIPNGTTINNETFYIQLEKGSVATDYRPYSPITHNNDAPVVFAESERQKSKNLFNNDGVILNTWIEGGKAKPHTGYFTTNYIKIDGQPYTVSATSLTSGSTQAFYDADKNYIVERSLPTYTGTNYNVPTNAVYVRSNYKIEELNNNIQYEIGTQATEYQQYNGPITHNNDAPVVFAENERQKSKNLFNYRNYLNLVSLYDYTDGAGYHCKRIALQPKTTYTISFPAKETTSAVVLLNRTENVNSSGYFDTRKTNDVKTYTTDNTGYLYIGVVGSNDTAINNLLSTLNLQIEEGTIATEYQKYNGAILHKGDLDNQSQITVGATLKNQNDTVVESYVSSDRNTWIRKWASGWKECGGRRYTTNSNTVSFASPIDFTDPDHTLVLAGTRDDGGAVQQARYSTDGLVVVKISNTGNKNIYFYLAGY